MLMTKVLQQPALSFERCSLFLAALFAPEEEDRVPKVDPNCVFFLGASKSLQRCRIGNKSIDSSVQNKNAK